MAVINGTTGADNLTGRGQADLIRGDSGPDTIAAGKGNDSVHGGGGHDVVKGAAGDDVLYGYSDADTRAQLRRHHDHQGGRGFRSCRCSPCPRPARPTTCSWSKRTPATSRS